LRVGERREEIFSFFFVCYLSFFFFFLRGEVEE